MTKFGFKLLALCILMTSISCEQNRNAGTVSINVAKPDVLLLTRAARAEGGVSIRITVNGDSEFIKNLSESEVIESESNTVAVAITVPETGESLITVEWYFQNKFLLASTTQTYNYDDSNSTTLAILPLSYRTDQKTSDCRRNLYDFDEDCVSNLNEYIRGTDLELPDTFPRMVPIPSLQLQNQDDEDCFNVGSPEGEGTDPLVYGDFAQSWRSSEEQIEVCVCRGFEISAYEVTFAQYAAYVDENSTAFPAIPNDQSMEEPITTETYSHPVVRVSPVDAERYAKWVSEKKVAIGETGDPYRLPTEIEWEYAARAGETEPFVTGSNILPNQANINSPRTMPVGSFLASENDWGLFDVHGNVEELTCSFHDSKPYKAADSQAFSCTETSIGGSPRWKVRGGAYFRSNYQVRFAYRNSGNQAQINPDPNIPTDFRVGRTDFTGFRLARAANPQSHLCQ